MNIFDVLPPDAVFNHHVDCTNPQDNAYHRSAEVYVGNASVQVFFDDCPK